MGDIDSEFGGFNNADSSFQALNMSDKLKSIDNILTDHVLIQGMTIGFIGFGLIGGSIARALRKIYPTFTLLAYDYHVAKPSSDLQAALTDGVLNKVILSLDEIIPYCDLIFLCAPVLNNIEYLKLIKPMLKKNCILTDVGSVKGNIHEAATDLGLDEHFIGGHPMTGSEKTGYANSYALLLENAYYILTPTSCTTREQLTILYNLVKAMGSLPILLDAREHDEITAAISHLPHIIAAQLVNLIKDIEGKDEKMRELAAGGFRDITRIASSSPIMWQNICLTNSKDITRILDKYIDYLSQVSKALTSRDSEYLYEMFDTAGAYRNKIPNKSTGLMRKIFEIYMDIKDEAGAIATIATLLASNQISIKNIGIIHNREFEEGVLRIEFYDDIARENAIELLNRYNYHIYQR